MTISVVAFKTTARFDREFGGAGPDAQQAARDALKVLQANPHASRLRMHSLSGYGKPTIWKIDVFANRSWQITFELEGDVAILRRMATHKRIDIDPRG